MEQQSIQETVWLEMDSFKTSLFLLKKIEKLLLMEQWPKSGPQEPFTVVWVNTKLYNIQRKPDFKLNVSIDVKPSAGFKRKANPTGAKCNRVVYQGGKWKINSCCWNMDMAML